MWRGSRGRGRFFKIEGVIPAAPAAAAAAGKIIAKNNSLAINWLRKVATAPVLHLLHLIVGTTEDALMSLWMLTHKLDAVHARDVRVTAVYVYWIAGIWVPIYAIIYIVSRT